VSGCSAGALIGAFYAYGFSFGELVKIMEDQRTTSLFPLRFDGLGLFGTDNLRSYLQQHLGDVTFADMKIPFFVTATDIESGREVVLHRGKVVDAVLASCSMPGIFAPVEIENRLLVDGGLCNNVPVSVLVAKGARYTVAVRLHRDVSGIDAAPVRRHVVVEDDATWRSISGWADLLTRTIRKDSSHLPNGMEVLGRAMEIVVAQLEGYRLQAYPPDILISPSLNHVSTLRFHENKAEIFARGEAAARDNQSAMERLKARMEREQRAH
jgi:NTE family protein